LLLELGAGAGRNTPRYQGYDRVVLLDYSRTQLQQAQQRLGQQPRYTFVAADIYRLPFIPGLFDGATMIRTLHHMADAPQALRQVRQVLQSGAVFILEFANKQNIKAILRYLARRQAWNPFSPEPVEFAALNFDFHPAAVRAWLKSSQFAIERQLTVSHFRMDVFKRLLPLGFLVSMDSLAQLTGNWWQLSPSVFVRARATGESLPAPSLDAQKREPEKGMDQNPFFRCPTCGEDLPMLEQDLDCPSCKARWPYQDGIYDFRGC
jgi:SAM-dependent methyltransferase